MLVIDPKKRPSCREILNHEFLYAEFGNLKLKLGDKLYD